MGYTIVSHGISVWEFTWEMNKMIGKVIAVQPFPSPYED